MKLFVLIGIVGTTIGSLLGCSTKAQSMGEVAWHATYMRKIIIDDVLLAAERLAEEKRTKALKYKGRPSFQWEDKYMDEGRRKCRIQAIETTMDYRVTGVNAISLLESVDFPVLCEVRFEVSTLQRKSVPIEVVIKSEKPLPRARGGGGRFLPEPPHIILVPETFPEEFRAAAKRAEQDCLGADQTVECETYTVKFKYHAIKGEWLPTHE